MNFLHDALLRAGVWLTDAAPTPQPAYTGDVNLITPGWIGFAMTLLVGVAVVLLAVDMNRRVRRTRYRGEVREMLEAEAEAEAAAERENSPSANK